MKLSAIIVGALTMLFLGTLSFIILDFIYRDDFPWGLTLLLALLCAVIGGFITACATETDRVRLGKWSGVTAGLLALVMIVSLSDLVVKAILIAVGLILLWAIGGRLGAYLRRMSSFLFD
jgi:hypothetical protein